MKEAALQAVSNAANAFGMLFDGQIAPESTSVRSAGAWWREATHLMPTLAHECSRDHSRSDGGRFSRRISQPMR